MSNQSGAVEVDVGALSVLPSPRADGVDLEHVAALASVFDHLPPIVVHAPSMRVIDGAHRLRAAVQLRRPRIAATLSECSDAEAEIDAIRLNVAHGKPLSRSDREAAVARVLGIAPEWSDRRIAVTCGVAPTTVDVIRRRTKAPAAVARVGRDGRVRSADPAAVRERIASLLGDAPHLSTREIARRARGSEATVRDVRRRQELGEPVLPARQRKNATASLARDPALHSDEELRRFSDWLTESTVDRGEWESFVDAVPLSRIYEVIDEARRRAESWQAFAVALERRARRA